MEYPPKDDADILEEEPAAKELVEKEPVPQINSKTGVSGDYRNEINHIKAIVEDVVAGAYDQNNPIDLMDLKIALAALNKKFAGQEFRKYTKRYSPDKFKNIITDQNRELIEEIDELVEELYSTVNVELTPENIEANKDKLVTALEIFNEIDSLVQEGTSRRIAA